jgi:hypothetical protein
MEPAAGAAPLWERDSLLGIKFLGAVFKINKQLAFPDIKALVFLVMPVPVKLPLENVQANQGVVDLSQRLVEPVMRAFLLQYINIDLLHGTELDVGPDHVFLAGFKRNPSQILTKLQSHAPTLKLNV